METGTTEPRLSTYLIIFVILLICRYLKDKKRQELREQMKANRQKCDKLQQEIDEIRRGM